MFLMMMTKEEEVVIVFAIKSVFYRQADHHTGHWHANVYDGI